MSELGQENGCPLLFHGGKKYVHLERVRRAMDNITEDQCLRILSRVDMDDIVKKLIENTEESFEDFWREYPRKIGKRPARIAFARATAKVSPFEIMKSLRKCKDTIQWQRDNGQFVPHPATWLRQERWNDEILVPTPTATTVFATRKISAKEAAELLKE